MQRQMKTDMRLCGFTLSKIGKYIYVNGGFIDGEAQGKMYKMDLNMNVLKVYEDSNYKPRTSHSVVFDGANLYFIFGSGTIFGQSNISDVAIFNIKTETYSFVNLPSEYARYGHSSVIYNNNSKILIFGGSSGRIFFDKFIIYDIGRKTIVMESCLIGGRYKHVMEKINDDCVIVYGGQDEKDVVTDMFTLNLKTMTSKFIKKTHIKTFTKESIVLGNLMIVCGGTITHNGYNILEVINTKTFKVCNYRFKSNSNKFHKIYSSYDNLKLSLYLCWGKTLEGEPTTVRQKIIFKTFYATFNFIQKYILNVPELVKLVMTFMY